MALGQKEAYILQPEVCPKQQTNPIRSQETGYRQTGGLYTQSQLIGSLYCGKRWERLRAPGGQVGDNKICGVSK